MARAPKLKVYDGIHDLLAELHGRGQEIAIVTRSPDMVPRAFIKLHKWPIDIVVGYHQVTRRKPDPEGLIVAMRQAGASADETFHVGDQPEDTEASRAANVYALGAAWGLTDTAALLQSKPDQIFESVSKLRKFFSKQC